MTAKEFVQSMYPEAQLIRWNMSQAAISISTAREPYLTLGWTYLRPSDDENMLWEHAKCTIEKMMLEKLEQ